MKERRSRTSRALRTAIAASLAVTGPLLLAALLVYLDTSPRESAALWAQFLLVGLSFALPALAMRTVMRGWRGRLAPP